MVKPPIRGADSIRTAQNLSAQGKDKQALAVIQKHLRKSPRDAAALNLAGTLAARLEDWPQAEKYFTATLALKPDDAYALYNLSKVFKLSNQAVAAINILTRLLKLEPGNVSALNEMGALLIDQGHVEPAIQAYRAVIDLDPTFEMGYRNLYAVLYFHARYEEAVEIAKRAIEHISSDYRWNFRTDLILCLLKIKEAGEARQLAERVIDELGHSNSPQRREHLLHALNNYGVVLIDMDEPEAAEVQFHKVIALSPGLVEPHVNLARLAVYREDFQGAIACFDKALAIAPDHAELRSHLAAFLRDAGRPDLALPHHYAALEKSPDEVEMRHYLGITQFALGQLDDAYKNWELRWSRREGGAKSDLAIPEWKGVPETGRSLLVYREQGLGDEVVFMSCLPDIAERFDRVICVCHSKLQTLFARSFPKVEFRSKMEALTAEDIADMDWQIAMGSMAAIVRPNLASFPRHPQLLVPDPEKTAFFRAQLAPMRTALKIGIGWRSVVLSLTRRMLYPYLEFWQALFEIPDITWVNLQYGDVTEELKNAEQQFGVSIVNFDDVDHLDDLDTSAALMKACDLVIGPITSTTAISAAVGTPTIMIYSGCDFFNLGTDHYPWLPSLSAIQRRFGEPWSEPIQRAADIVRVLAAERRAV